LKEQIYHRSLKIIEEIYNESQYGIDDLYRIKDIVHSLDDNHWVGKQWLIDTLYPLYNKIYGTNTSGKIYIAGGWYGLQAHLIKQVFKNFHVITGDMDPMTEHFGHRLFSDTDIEFKVENCLDSIDLNADIIINTSCEHMDKEDLETFISLKPKESIIILQSNDYGELDSHINCSSSLEEFVESVEPFLSKNWIISKSQIDLGDFNRFMIIGQ